MLPIYRPRLAGNERKYVNECLESSWISSRGEFIDRFEQRFKGFVNIPYGTTVSNGTVALHVALLALGIAPGDEVIVPALTYVAPANMIAHAGATPVFVDCDPDTWQVNVADVRAAITPRTRAVLAVHLYGACGDIEGLRRLCDEHGLWLVEDCAEALGTLFRGQHVGATADVATFSFFGNKTITTGEGGMVVSRRREVIERAFHLKTQAVSPTHVYLHDEIGFNYRMTNICAAIGLAQLEQVDDILRRKRQIAAWYDHHLRDAPVVRQAIAEGCEPSWWLYSTQVAPEHRDGLQAFLRAQDIETRPVFPSVHTFRHFQPSRDLPVSQAISASGISLPSFPDLSEGDVARVCYAIRGYFAGSAASPRVDDTLPEANPDTVGSAAIRRRG